MYCVILCQINFIMIFLLLKFPSDTTVLLYGLFQLYSTNCMFESHFGTNWNNPRKSLGQEDKGWNSFTVKNQDYYQVERGWAHCRSPSWREGEHTVTHPGEERVSTLPLTLIGKGWTLLLTLVEGGWAHYHSPWWREETHNHSPERESYIPQASIHYVGMHMLFQIS